MNTEQVRRMIAEAVQHEEQTGAMAQNLNNYFITLGKPMNVQGINSLVEIVKVYIKNVPDLLDEAMRVAKKEGWWQTIAPALEACQAYFLNPNDLIPDYLGLGGLADDAYLANSLLQCLSDGFKQQTGRPLISGDMTPANKIVRFLLGEPIAATLDNSIRILIQGPSMQDIIGSLVSLAGASNVYLPGGSFDDHAIQQNVNLQMDLITSSYSPSW